MTIAILSKTCTKCGNTEPLSSFTKQRASKDGLAPHCRVCRSADKAKYYLANTDRARIKSAEWSKANPEKVKANLAAWRITNADKIKADSISYHSTNRERLNISSAAYRAANADGFAAYRAAYRTNNPGRARAQAAARRAANPEPSRIEAHNRRARLREDGGRLSKGLSAKLFKLQKGKCPCCAKPLGDDFHLNHKTPLFLGGSNTDDNMQLLRRFCNLSKSHKHPVDFMQSRGFLI